MIWIKDTKFWVGCMLGFLIGVMVSAYSSSIVKSGNSLISSTSTTTPDSITSTDQSAGDKVYVPTLSVGQTSWVAVRENNNDVIGRILGAQRVDAGVHENILVDLLRPTDSQVMYAVVLYKDDGDGEFDPKIDELIIKNGEPILSQFIAK
jgi:hypothetical protein